MRSGLIAFYSLPALIAGKFFIVHCVALPRVWRRTTLPDAFRISHSLEILTTIVPLWAHQHRGSSF
jgi:hypothetical protein